MPKGGLHRLIPLNGTKVGLYSVVDYAGKGYWNCVCECGTKRRVWGQSLRSRKTSGCFGCSGRRKRVTTRGDLRELYKAYKVNAHKAGRLFSLTIEEFEKITSRPCTYCGAPPSQRPRGNRYWLNPYYYNGIDRIDSSKGYTPDNSAPACGVCNIMKKDMSVDEFLNHIRQVHEHNADAVEETTVYAS